MGRDNYQDELRSADGLPHLLFLIRSAWSALYQHPLRLQVSFQAYREVLIGR